MNFDDRERKYYSDFAKSVELEVHNRINKRIRDQPIFVKREWMRVQGDNVVLHKRIVELQKENDSLKLLLELTRDE